MKIQTKTLKYYLSLPYIIELRNISGKEGGGVNATFPELGRDAFVAHGNTIDEAVASLRGIQEYLLKHFIKKGYKIPEPEKIENFSGKLVLRISPSLHKRMAGYAKKNNMSLNSAIVIAMEKNLQMVNDTDEIKRYIDKFMESFNQKMDTIEPKSTYTYNLKNSPKYFNDPNVFKDKISA